MMASFNYKYVSTPGDVIQLNYLFFTPFKDFIYFIYLFLINLQISTAERFHPLNEILGTFGSVLFSFGMG